MLPTQVEFELKFELNWTQVEFVSELNYMCALRAARIISILKTN